MININNKNKLRFLTTIQARMNSSRLHGKVCLKFEKSKNTLEILIDRLKKSKYANKILIATTAKKNDDKIVSIAKEKKCLCYRGSEKNVLQRLVNATKIKNVNTIIQLTGDNPFIDPLIIDYIVEFFIKNYPKYDYVTNNNLFDKKKSVPLGMIVSVFKAKSLKEISKLANKQEHFEHPSLYFYQEGKNKFKIKNLKMPNKWCSKLNPRLTLDTKEDYIFLKKIYNDLKHKDNFTLIDIFRLLKNKRNYLSINKNIKQKIPSTLKKSKLNL